MAAALLTAQEAAERLGGKPATLYAYVSRGQLRRERGPDGPTRFSLTDVDRLAPPRRPARPPRRRCGSAPATPSRTRSPPGSGRGWRPPTRRRARWRR